MYPEKRINEKYSTMRMAMLLDAKNVIAYVYSIPNDKNGRYYRFDHKGSPMNLASRDARPYFAALMRENGLSF